ncbi:MAG: sulfur transfer complex TusBCD TusB component (DsrH family) [Crocinitomix sp.]|jgi:sulfur transfer complex TusBCD TusB component (DsrH family)
MVDANHLEIISGEEWSILDHTVEDMILTRNGLASAVYKESFEKPLEEQLENLQLISLLEDVVARG